MTTSSKSTHSTSGMARRAHFPRTLEGIVIDAQDRFHSRRPRPGTGSESGPARSCFRSFSRLRSTSTRFGRLRATRQDVAQDHDSLDAHSDERVLDSRAIVIPFSEDTRRSTYVRKRSRDLHRLAKLQYAVVSLNTSPPECKKVRKYILN